MALSKENSSKPRRPDLTTEINVYTWHRWLLVGGIGVFLVVMTSSVISNFASEIAEKRVEHSIMVQVELSTLQAGLNDAETSQRGYVITSDRAYLEQYEKAKLEIPSALRRLTNLTNDNAKQVTRTAELAKLIDLRMRLIAQSVDFTTGGKRAQAEQIIQQGGGKALMDRIRAVLSEMRDEEAKLFNERSQNALSLRRIELVLILGSLLLAAALAAWLYQAMRGELNSLERISGELKTTNLELEQRVRDRTDALERSQKDIRADRDRLGSLLMASAQIFWMTSADGETMENSPTWQAFTGQSIEDWNGSGWLAVVHPDDRERVALLWENSKTHTVAFATEYRLRHVSGDWRWTAANAVPLLGSGGAISGWIGMNSDISERKKQEEDLAFVMRELSHRTKNLLAMVQAMSRQTARQSRNLNDFIQIFSGRLQALARSHDALLQRNWQGASLADLIAGHIVPLESGSRETRLHAHGPDINFKPEAAQTIGLALHELWTNATKYGALSTPAGRVDINWSVEAGDEPEQKNLQIVWQESGGPTVTPPTRKGFGRTVIEGMVAQTLGGTVSLDFNQSGVRWMVTAPMTNAAMVAPNAPPVMIDALSKTKRAASA